MNTTARKRAQLAASLLGVAVVIPLLTPSASASPSDGRFQVTAVDSENASITSTVGSLGSTGSNPGPGTGNPGTGNPGTGDPGTGSPGEQPADAAVASYSCGPLSFDITQEMIDFSKPNEELYKAGRASEMVAHPDGWKMIVTEHSTGLAPGFPAEGFDSRVVKLGEDLELLTGTVRYLALEPTSCFIEDNRIAPRENATFMVGTGVDVNENTYFSEGRWITEEGKLRKVNVSDYGNSVVISRRESSDRYPAMLTQKDGVSTFTDIEPIEVVDGVKKVRRTLQLGGGYTYSLWGDGTTDALRKNGPNYISVDSTGKIRGLKYADSDGETQTISPLLGNTNAEVITRYNNTTGQSWDGSLPDFDRYELSVPFIPNKF